MNIESLNFQHESDASNETKHILTFSLQSVIDKLDSWESALTDQRENIVGALLKWTAYIPNQDSQGYVNIDIFKLTKS